MRQISLAFDREIDVGHGSKEVYKILWCLRLFTQKRMTEYTPVSFFDRYSFRRRAAS